MILGNVLKLTWRHAREPKARLFSQTCLQFGINLPASSAQCPRLACIMADRRCNWVLAVADFAIWACPTCSLTDPSKVNTLSIYDEAHFDLRPDRGCVALLTWNPDPTAGAEQLSILDIKGL